MIIFGHRGAPGFPRQGENTIASFNKALAAGAGGLEFDVRRCRDGKIIVIHDDTIDRTTSGRGRVADFTSEELGRLDIPILSDVLDQFGSRCLLNIELKEPGLGGNVKNLVLERRLEQRVIVSAFQWTELESLAPAIPVAPLSSKAANLIETAHSLRAVAIHPRKDIAVPGLIAAAREAKLRVHVWTVNEPHEIAHFCDLGVDGIFTDFPERCMTSAS